MIQSVAQSTFPVGAAPGGDGECHAGFTPAFSAQNKFDQLPLNPFEFLQGFFRWHRLRRIQRCFRITIRSFVQWRFPPQLPKPFPSVANPKFSDERANPFPRNELGWLDAHQPDPDFTREIIRLGTRNPLFPAGEKNLGLKVSCRFG